LTSTSRRGFLGKLGLGSAAAAALTQLKPVNPENLDAQGFIPPERREQVMGPVKVGRGPAQRVSNVSTYHFKNRGDQDLKIQASSDEDHFSLCIGPGESFVATADLSDQQERALLSMLRKQPVTVCITRRGGGLRFSEGMTMEPDPGASRYVRGRGWVKDWADDGKKGPDWRQNS